MINLSTNLSSLLVQSSLKTSSLKLNEAIERMSTGCKLNHSKDNAANYSIATSLTTKINSYQIAEDNAMMGLDMVQTASSALSTMSDLTTRLRSLAIQAQNGTYGKTSLSAINSEANAIVDEMERTISYSNFNGINLFRGQTQGTESSNFISAISRRDTSKMKKLSEADFSNTLTGTYSIGTKEELMKLAEMTNNGLVDSSAEFVLSSDIDLENMEWTPIGSNTQSFQASFDGNGYVISNLSITNASVQYSGLFGSISGGNIQNVGIDGVNVSGNNFVAALAGYATRSSISNCYSINGSVSNKGAYAGGLIGWHLVGNAENCYSTCDVSGLRYVGGLIGVMQGGNTTSGCYSSGKVQANSHGGGFVGVLCDTSAVFNSYTSSNIQGSGSRIGGLVGEARTKASITNCYVAADNSGIEGGLVGMVSASEGIGTVSLKNCYLLGESDFTRGLMVGSIEGLGQDCTIIDCGYSEFYNININPLIGSAGGSTSGITSCSADFLPFTIDSNAEITNYNSNVLLQVGINSESNSQLNLDLDFSFNGLTYLRNIGNIKWNILTVIDRLNASLSQHQTELGATENRLTSALESISIQYENLVSSRSTIQDADISEVSSEYIRQQILQQASATLMATANQTPAVALQLL